MNDTNTYEEEMKDLFSKIKFAHPSNPDLINYIEGAASDFTQAQIRSHLRLCPTCGERLAYYKELNAYQHESVSTALQDFAKKLLSFKSSPFRQHGTSTNFFTKDLLPFRMATIAPRAAATSEWKMLEDIDQRIHCSYWEDEERNLIFRFSTRHLELIRASIQLIIGTKERAVAFEQASPGHLVAEVVVPRSEREALPDGKGIQFRIDE